MLLQKLPEGWKIPAMIGAVSQLAQIGPILLLFLKCKCLSCFDGPRVDKLKRKQVPDRIIVYALFLIGLTAGSTLALFWDQTAHVFGKERSMVFFACVFSLAILDCTCTIVFLTYIGYFRGNYICALYIGEGISSLLPSLFALLQGVGEDENNECIALESNRSSAISEMSTFLNTSVNEANEAASYARQPRFGISAYFWLLFSTLVVSFFAFLLLDLWPSFAGEKIHHKQLASTRSRQHNLEMASMSTAANKESKEDTEVDDDSLARNVLLNENKMLMIDEQLDNQLKMEKAEPDAAATSANSAKTETKYKKDKLLLYVCISVVGFTLYGILPGLSSYSALPYGTEIMHKCVTLGE
jgi:hypothetical protein